MRPQCRGPFLAVVLLVLNVTAAAGSIEDLLRAYPDQLAGADGRNPIWRNGTLMPIGEPGPERSPEKQLRHGSILDQIRLRYRFRRTWSASEARAREPSTAGW